MITKEQLNKSAEEVIKDLPTIPKYHHLALRGSSNSWCGQLNKIIPNPLCKRSPWAPGTKYCPKCGVKICPTCLKLAS